MKLSELPIDFTFEQFMQLDKESLDQVPYQRRKWFCQCKKCQNGTHVRDYGISPFFFLDRNSKHSETHTKEYWSNLNLQIWFCGKHLKLYNRLSNLYGKEKTSEKLYDFIMPLDGKLSEPLNEMQPVKQIENEYSKNFSFGG